MNPKEKALKYLIRVDKTKDVEKDYLPKYYEYEIKAIELAIKEAKKEVFDDIEKRNKAIGYIKLTGGFYLKLREKHLENVRTK